MGGTYPGYNTLRHCQFPKCGVPIRSKNFTNRLPENKVDLCKKHLLKSKRTGEDNPNYKTGFYSLKGQI
jgi:hypothetical protein